MEQSKTEEEVKIRHQTWLPASVAKAFEEECRRERRDAASMLRVILEDRYGSGKK